MSALKPYVKAANRLLLHQLSDQNLLDIRAPVLRHNSPPDTERSPRLDACNRKHVLSRANTSDSSAVSAAGILFWKLRHRLRLLSVQLDF
jgi:hypothetical protein